jgi:hypothetical protein
MNSKQSKPLTLNQTFALIKHRGGSNVITGKLSDLVQQVHDLWREVETIDDRETRKACFAQIAKVEKQIRHEIELTKKPVPEW